MSDIAGWPAPFAQSPLRWLLAMTWISGNNRNQRFWPDEQSRANELINSDSAWDRSVGRSMQLCRFEPDKILKMFAVRVLAARLLVGSEHDDAGADPQRLHSLLSRTGVVDALDPLEGVLRLNQRAQKQIIEVASTGYRAAQLQEQRQSTATEAGAFVYQVVAVAGHLEVAPEPSETLDAIAALFYLPNGSAAARLRRIKEWIKGGELAELIDQLEARELHVAAEAVRIFEKTDHIEREANFAAALTLLEPLDQRFGPGM